MEEETIATQQTQSGSGGPEPRISMVLGVFATIFFLLVDALSLIPGVGDIESLLSTFGIVIGLVSNVGATIVSTWSIVTVVKFIPGLQEIPLWTPGWLFVWYAENHPSSIESLILQEAQEAASLEGGGAALEGGEAAGAGIEGANATGAAGAQGAAGAGGTIEAEGGYASNNGEVAGGEGGGIEGEEGEDGGKKKKTNVFEEEEPDLPDVNNDDDDRDERARQEARNALIPDAERDPEEVEEGELLTSPPGMDFTDWNNGNNGKTDQDKQ